MQVRGDRRKEAVLPFFFFCDVSKYLYLVFAFSKTLFSFSSSTKIVFVLVNFRLGHV